jgi:hypothetical protein
MRNEWSKTTAKNARVDARERHLWLAKKGGVPRGVSILTKGVTASLPTGLPLPSILNPACPQQPSTSPTARPSRRPSGLNEPQSPSFRAKPGS